MMLEHRLRRALATLLIVLFSFALFTPLLAANPLQDLPSCCRRDGKHHCAMDGAAGPSQSGGPAFGSRCPLFPQICWSLNAPSSLALQVPHRVMAVFLPASAVQHAAWLAPHSLLRGTERKRGPPLRFE